MGTPNRDPFNPEIAINRFSLPITTNLGLSVTYRYHSIRSILYMDNQTIFQSTSIIFGSRVVNSRHELVFRTVANFSNDRALVLQFADIDSGPLRRTEDRKLCRITNFSFTMSILSKNIFRTQNTTNKGLAEEILIRRTTLTDSEVIVVVDLCRVG